MSVKFAAFSSLIFAIGLTTPVGANATDSFRLSAGWAEGSVNGAEIKNWSLTDLSKLKCASSRERDPVNGEVVKWKGVLLSAVIEDALSGVPPEKKAQIDLVVLRNSQGGQALIPRAFVQKYPLLLATQREASVLSGAQGPLYSIVPWTSNAKIQQEGVPLESFFVSGVTRIEFANYREKYGNFFLKRRTDPSAMRGEKLFVQNCITCHAAGQGPAVSRLVVSTTAGNPPGHSQVKGAPKMTDRDRRSLESYLNAFTTENGLPSSSTANQLSPTSVGKQAALGL